MKVLFDGFWWVDGPAANRTVQREFILTWAEEFPDDELLVAVRRKHAESSGDLPVGVREVHTKLWPQAVSNAVELPHLARRHGVDAVLAHNFAPVSGKNLTFIHDVMFQEHPEWFSRSERAYFALMPLLAPRASVLATSAETEVARIAVENPRLDAVHATGLAVGRELDGLEPTMPEAVAGLEAFAVTVGRLNVRKNLAASIEAAGASAIISPERPLLIVGGTAHSGVEAVMTPAARAALERGDARFIGRVSDAELAWLYTNASLVTSLSLDEGFGLPPVEAARFGAPLLVSDIPVFRETVGEIAHFVDPLARPETLGAAIDEAWAQPGPVAGYRDVLDRYSWPTVVRALRNLLA